MAKFFSLKKNNDIVSVIKKNKRLHLQDITICYKKNELNIFRLAISVSKKNFKLAVRRNRIKRLIKAWFMTIKNDCLGYDIVVIVKPSFVDGSFILKCKNLEKKLQLLEK